MLKILKLLKEEYAKLVAEKILDEAAEEAAIEEAEEEAEVEEELDVQEALTVLLSLVQEAYEQTQLWNLILMLWKKNMQN